MELRNYKKFISKFRNILKSHGYSDKLIVGKSGGKIRIFYKNNFNNNLPNILIMSGQHGEEIAGPWAILKVLEKKPEILEKANITFIPIVNIYGFKSGKRKGSNNIVTNYPLKNDNEIRKKVSIEDDVLINNISLLGKFSKDGFLNLHEDKDSHSTGFYMYVMGDSTSEIVDKMQSVGKKFFNFKSDGIYHDNGVYEIKNGIVNDLKDYTFDYFITQKFDIPLSITIETPAKNGINIWKRVSASGSMMIAFVNGINKQFIYRNSI